MALQDSPEEIFAGSRAFWRVPPIANTSTHSRGVNESAIKNQQVRRLSAASCALSRIRAIRFCSTGFSRGSRRSPLGWADVSRSRAKPGLRRWRDLCSNRSERRTNTARDADHQVLFLLNETLLSWTHRSLLKRSVLWRAHHLEHNDRLLETRLPAERLINEWAARHSRMRWRAADHFPNARYLFGEVEWPPWLRSPSRLVCLSLSELLFFESCFIFVSPFNYLRCYAKNCRYCLPLRPCCPCFWLPLCCPERS